MQRTKSRSPPPPRRAPVCAEPASLTPSATDRDEADEFPDDEVEVVTVSDVEEDDCWHGIDDQSRSTLALALGVDLQVTPVETLAYSLLCKIKRGATLQKSDILQVWDSLPKKFVLRDKDDRQARMVVLGVNPRCTKTSSVASANMPHVHELLKAYVLQICPSFTWTCLCIRQNCSKPPHRDTRNVGNNMIVALTEHQNGGGLWVYDHNGGVYQLFQGRQLPGRTINVQNPFVFSARSLLHATEPWKEARRVVLVAFTPIGSLTLQQPPTLQSAPRQSRIYDFFGVSTRTD